MKRVQTAATLRREVRRHRAQGKSIGFVPTMGYLHAGHLSLVRKARKENELVVVSIFVNPTQFGPSEDYDAYPRDLRRDRKLLRQESVDLLYEPEASAMYPDGFATQVEVRGLDEQLCGASRPGHFRGVCTIVAKLLNAADPDRLYLGQKDYQQAAILTRMVEDLDLPVRVVIGRTVREEDGLAMSSRNAYLDDAERAFAPRLHAALRSARAAVISGSVNRASNVTGALRKELAGGPGSLEYVELLSRERLETVDRLQGKLVLALAYRLGRARLIDNIWIDLPKAPKKAATKSAEDTKKSAAPRAAVKRAERRNTKR